MPQGFPKAAKHAVYSAAVDNMGDGYCVFDSAGALLFWTDALTRNFPALKGELVLGTPYCHLAKALRRLGARDVLPALDDDEGWNVNASNRFANKLEIELTYDCANTKFISLQRVLVETVGWLLVASDITLERKESRALESGWFWVLDSDLNYRYHSAHCSAMDVSKPYQFVGMSRISSIAGKANDNEQLREHNRAILAHEPVDCILTWPHPGGRLHYTHVTADPQYDNEGLFNGYIGCGRNCTTDFELREQSEYHASHDQLTGVMNRQAFEKILQIHLENFQCGKTTNEEQALIRLDLDRFKLLNYDLGCEAGDALLVQIASLLKDLVHDSDFLVARLGGDEFAIFGSQTKDNATALSHRIIHQLNNFHFIEQDRTLVIGASMGLAMIDASLTCSTDWLKQADAARHSAKMKGRNRVEVFSVSNIFQKRQDEELATLKVLHSAFKDNRFVLYLQPIANSGAASNTIHQYEVLVRLLDESGKIVMPDAFIPTAEKYDLMKQIDLYIVEQSVEAVSSLAEQGQVTRLAVNLSGGTLDCHECLDNIAAFVEKSQHSGSSLCFEITETAAINNLDAVNAFMNRLRAQGCRFALDDFGSGLSSYRYLESLQVDYIKIDGAFVSNMLNEKHSRAIVKSINTLSHEMGMQTVAEFVETPAQVVELTSMGVDYLQGYFFGKPLPLMSIIEPRVHKEVGLYPQIAE